MKNAYNAARPASLRAVRPFISALLCLLLLAGLIPLRAQDAAAPSPAPASASVLLQFQDASFYVASWGVPIRTTTAAFSKEPTFGRNKALRGTFQFGSHPNLPAAFTTNEMAFVWDRTAKKLYLDLNRNLDLTDDGGGVLASTVSGETFQHFTNLRLSLQTQVGRLPVLMDLSLYAYGNQPSCTAQLHSFWQGQLTLAGQDCQVGLVPIDFNQLYQGDKGRLLVRPWAARAQLFGTSGNSLETFPFAANLFVYDHAFQVACSPEPAAPSPRLQLRFTEQHPSLGELKLPGKFIHRLIFEGGPYQVVLDQPKKLVRIPVGTYAQPQVWLKVGAAEAYRTGLPPKPGLPITITASQPATCTAGGPLTNSVAVFPQGRMLTLQYQVVGAEGAIYQLASQNRSQPPRFTIRKDGKVIASGKFEFG